MGSQRDWLITVDGVEGAFSTKSGGDTVSDATRDYDGGSDDPVILTGPPVTEPWVVGRRFDVARDNRVIKKNRPRVGSWETTITAQPLVNGVPEDEPTVARGKLVRQTDPEVDRNSSQPARYELTFEIISVR